MNTQTNHIPSRPRRFRGSLPRMARAGVCAIAGLWVLAAPAASWAQRNGPGGFQERHGRVEREIERTQELWNDVSARVDQTSAAPLRDLVQQAGQVQMRAKQALQAAASMANQDMMGAEERLRISLSLTLRARDMTTRAARQLREELSLEENARRTIDRLEQRYERLRGDEDATRSPLWAQAGQLFEQARAQWRDGNFEQALRLAQNANNVLESLEDKGGASIDPERVRAELRRTEELWQRMRDRAGDREVPALEQAGTQLREAREALANGRTELAAERIRTARRLLAGMDDRGSADGAQIERALARLDAQIERFDERMGDDAPASARRLLRQAVEERDRARRALQSGNEEQARQHVRAAADLLARIQKQLGGRG